MGCNLCNVFHPEQRSTGHFNVSDSVVLQAVTFAARDAGLPVIIGLSESERKLPIGKGTVFTE
jgi:fructose/tagatose bisphosphate aldolase